MRIAMISEHASPLAVLGSVDAGGQNLHVCELAAALTRAGHHVTVYTRRDRSDVEEVVRSEHGFRVVHVPAGPAITLDKDDLLPYMQQFAGWMSHRLSAQSSRPDVLHAHFWMSGVAAVEVRSTLSIPVVLTYHALGVVKRRFQKAYDTSPTTRVAIERQLGRTVDRVIAQCRNEVCELDALGISGASVEVIPSGVDTARFDPSGPSAGRTPGRFSVLAVGRLVPRKGFDDVIRAVAATDDAELVIVGGPAQGARADPEGRRLIELASRLGVADRVNLVGPVPAADMATWYRSADVVACAPWYEPFGLTPLEAMACGVPVVTYAVGGLQDTVSDGVTGLHVRPGDVAGLIGALQTLRDDRGLRIRLGRGALSVARSRYSWQTAATRLADVYAELASARAQSEKVAS